MKERDIITLRKEINLDKRKEIITLYKAGFSIREISDHLQINYFSVRKIIKKWNEFGTVDNLSGRGRKRCTTKAEDRIILRTIKKNRFISSSLTSLEMKEFYNIKVSSDTVIRRAKEIGLFPRIARKKPFLSKINKKKRFEFSKKYKDWEVEDWEKVLWTDETKINLHSSDGKIWVWRFEGEELDDELISKTYQHSDSIMVWCSISSNGVGSIHIIDGKMNAKIYLKILKKYLFFDGNRLIGEEFIFQRDNDPKHKSGPVSDWLTEKGVEVLGWASNSPDMNPIENCFHILKSKLRKLNINNKNDLIKKLAPTWNSISQEYCYSLIESMINRISELYKNKGGYTSY